MGKKKCAMFGRSQVKIPFSAYELNIALHNKTAASFLTVLEAEHFRHKVEGLTSNSQVSQ